MSNPFDAINPAVQLQDFLVHEVLPVGLVIVGFLGLLFAPGILGRIVLGVVPMALAILLYLRVIG